MGIRTAPSISRCLVHKEILVQLVRLVIVIMGSKSEPIVLDYIESTRSGHRTTLCSTRPLFVSLGFSSPLRCLMNLVNLMKSARL